VIVNPADDDKATAASAIDTGNVDTGGKASTPPTDMTIDDTNCPTGTLGIIPTGPSDDTHITNSNINGTLVVNSDIAASPTLEETTMGPNDGTLTVNSDIAASPTTHTGITIDDTNSPTDTLGIIPTGPSDDTHTTNSNINDTLVVNSDVAASPTLEEATMGPNGDTLTVNPDIAASPTPEGNAASAVDAGSHDNTHVIDSDTTASPTLKRKRKYSPTKAGQRRRRWCNDGRDLNSTTRAPNSGGAQAGGDGGGGV
jgi:hypothetical protein